jgi:anti-sigma regulatory factor (Ser/Thr protein kinase)
MGRGLHLHCIGRVAGADHAPFICSLNLSRMKDAMSGLQKSFFIMARDFVHAGEAAIRVQQLLKAMQFDPRLIRRVAVCCYEGEMNVVMHGGDGHLKMELDRDVLNLEISDDGPGIPDIELAMQPGYSTASDDQREMGFGAGMGLPNMKKNADSIAIESPPGEGTRVHLRFLLNAEG